MKKLIAAITTGLIAVALVVVGAAAPASAHTATFTATSTCNSDTGAGSVTFTLDNDWPETLNVVTSTNQTVIPDATTVAATSGHGDTTKQFVESIPAPAAGVSASITLTFEWTGDGYTQGNTTASATVSSECAAHDASATITDTPATCGSPETVAENTISNAKWTTDVTTSPYDLVATADAGHKFSSASTGGVLSDGNSVETFSGTLKTKNANDCKVAAAVLTFNPATCQGAETVAEGTTTDATWAGPITYPTSTTYSAVATANSGFEFPSGADVTNGGTTLTLTGSLDAQLSGHPCEDFQIVAWHMPSWAGRPRRPGRSRTSPTRRSRRRT